MSLQSFNSFTFLKNMLFHLKKWQILTFLRQNYPSLQLGTREYLNCISGLYMK